MFFGNFGYQHARASAAAPGKKKKSTIGSNTPCINTHERCSTREDQAHRHNGNAQWQHRGCGPASRLRAPKFRALRAFREYCSSLTPAGAAGEGAEAHDLQPGEVFGACRSGRRRWGSR